MPKYLSDEVEALAQYVGPEVATLRGEKTYDPLKLRSVSLTAAAQLSDTPRHSYSRVVNAGWQTSALTAMVINTAAMVTVSWKPKSPGTSVMKRLLPCGPASAMTRIMISVPAWKKAISRPGPVSGFGSRKTGYDLGTGRNGEPCLGR